MNVKLIFNQYLIDNYCKSYNTDKEDIIHNDLHYFRYVCCKYNCFMRNIKLPTIPLYSHYEAVLIEFRKFPHLEFLIRNAILKLGEKWSFTVICGNMNVNFITKICNRISPNINIIKVNIDNMLPFQYNKFLTSLSFWNMLHGEKIFIYQEDSMIFTTLPEEFLQYDYIGAPFPKYQNDTPNSVGNGGLSLRSKSIMIKILSTISVKKTTFNSSTLDYMKQQRLSFPPEDVYYSKNAQELGIGIVANFDTASLFSSESIFNENSFGGHKFWISNPNWKNNLKSTFKYSSYTSNSDIIHYLNCIGLNSSYDKNPIIKNAFDVDLYFCNLVNNLSMSNKEDIIKYIQMIGMDGYIYHPKQLLNIYCNIKLYTFLDNLFILYKYNIYIASDFINKFLYNYSFDDLSKILIKNKSYNLNKNIPLLLLVFIGNEERYYDLIDKIIHYKTIQLFNVSFCFNVNIKISKKIKYKITSNFDFYAIYETKEFGTDITPTMLMYNEISKIHKFEHIIKLQTKSIITPYLELTNFLLNHTLQKMLVFKNPTCNCIGHPNYYIPLEKDAFNNDLKIRYISHLHVSYSFVGGTIFYSPEIVFAKTLEFMKNNYRSYLFNNLYENNSINVSNSPIHFLERVFGIIKC